MVSEVHLDLSSLPTISDKNSWETFVDGVNDRYDTCGITYRACWRDHRYLILFGLFLLTIGLVIGLAIVLQPAGTSYPCLRYDHDTLASSVSVECLQYTWSKSCSSPYTFPTGYTGWWNQSPAGTRMVPCSGTSACGVGSYGNIIVYMGFCQIRLNQ